MPVSYGLPVPPRFELVDFLEAMEYRAFKRGSIVTFFSPDPARGKQTRFLWFFKGAPKLRQIGSVVFETHSDWKFEYSGDDLVKEVEYIAREISHQFPSITIHTTCLGSQPVFENK